MFLRKIVVSLMLATSSFTLSPGASSSEAALSTEHVASSTPVVGICGTFKIAWICP